MTDLRSGPGPGSGPIPGAVEPDGRAHPSIDDVVLLDARGRPFGTRPKPAVHHRHTPLHLGFSCYLVDRDSRVLVTQRALTKQTFPGVWTNACCGHPRPGETLRAAVARRLSDELGVRPRRMALALPDFVYRARTTDGRTEHELCPVVVAEIDEAVGPVPDPAEVADLAWLDWAALLARAIERPSTLSPWSVVQIRALDRLAAPSPAAWLDRPDLHFAGLDRAPTTEPASSENGNGNGNGAEADPSGSFDPLGPVRAGVDAVVDRFVTEREDELRALDPRTVEVAEEIRRLVDAGGKRLRPAFVHWGGRAAGTAADDEGVLVAAAAVELLHTFALLHDDVMDRSQRRRGEPTAHVALGLLHLRRGLAGDHHWFGTGAAVLAGDLCFVWADQLFESAPLPAPVLAAGRRVFTQLRTEVIGGQYLDLRLAHDPDGGEELAEQVALLKSARYTVTRPLLLGAALAGADDPSLIASLTTYGDAVGLAFQLRDDVLGLFGDPASTGKACTDDLREGKRTLLVLRALRLTTGADHRFLRRSLGNPDLDLADAHRCRDIVAASGARASVEARIEAERSRALAAIATLDPTPRAALTHLAALATARTH
jgi:isopentenyl-diphosphate delta-isomerase type 1